MTGDSERGIIKSLQLRKSEPAFEVSGLLSCYQNRATAVISDASISTLVVARVKKETWRTSDDDPSDGQEEEVRKKKRVLKWSHESRCTSNSPNSNLGLYWQRLGYRDRCVLVLIL